MDHIYCLATRGCYLTPDLSTFLYHAAQEAISDDCRSLRIGIEEMQGELTTSYSVGHMGPMTGLVFKATLDFSNGKTSTVDFIVKPASNRQEWGNAQLHPVKISVREFDPSRN